MKRRDAVSGLLALAAVIIGSLGANAQAPKGDKPFLIATLPDLRPQTRGWFSDAMRDLGWTEGRNFIVVQSGQSGLSYVGRQRDDAARRVAADKPDLVLTVTTADALAVHRKN